MWFGAIGEGAQREVTAVGDAMNVAARLASSAAAGEILVTTAAAAAAGLDGPLEQRDMVVRGRSGAVSVVALHAAPPA